MSNVLITGGSGLIGNHLSNLLEDQGFSIGHLTRKKSEISDGIRRFYWNPSKNQIDKESVHWADHVVHLAGESVAQRWTKTAKERIINSRVDSSEMLINAFKKEGERVKSFISASAIGFYGKDTGDKVISEVGENGMGFLADVVEEWERSNDSAQEISDHLVRLRIGVVLTPSGGALEKIVSPIKMYVGAPLGKGSQWMSWVHVEDLCRMIFFAIERELNGVFNAVSPSPVTNKEFTKVLAKKLRRPLFLPNVPTFMLKIILGEMSEMVVGGNRVAPMGFQEEGFKFEYDSLDKALDNIF